MGENVALSDTRTDLWCLVPPRSTLRSRLTRLVLVPKQPATTTSILVVVIASACVGVGVGRVPSSSNSSTVRNDVIDPLSLLSSSSSSLRSLRLGVWAKAGSTLTRGDAEGITIGFGSGTGGGEWFRSAPSAACPQVQEEYTREILVEVGKAHRVGALHDGYKGHRVRGRHGEELGTHEGVSPKRRDLYSLVPLASTGGAAAEAKTGIVGIVVSQMMMVQMLAAVAVAPWRVRRRALFKDSR